VESVEQNGFETYKWSHERLMKIITTSRGEEPKRTTLRHARIRFLSATLIA
jgi:hypothetical protein